MNRRSFLQILASIFAPRSAIASSLTAGNPLRFYSGKPITRWWWFACDIRRNDISEQLGWIKSKGFGGVEIAWVFPPRGSDPWTRAFPGITPEEKARRQRAPKWLSEDWSSLVEFAKTEADRIGLSCDFTFGTLWPFGDTRVSLQDASRQFDIKHPRRDRDELQLLALSWEQPAQGLVIDHLNSAAFERYADRIGKALAPAMHGSKSAIFCDSWEVHAKTLWTDGFEEAFLRRYGYDIQPLMKTLWQHDSADVRYDYLTLIADLVIENFYRPLSDTARSIGGFSRVQVAGSPTDVIAAYALMDVPETEAMLYEPAFGRVVASAATMAKRPEVSSETFTCIYGFPSDDDPLRHHSEEQPADLKLVADALLANGVNQIVWHGTPFTPAGAAHDFRFYATVHVGREGTLSEHLTEFNGYMESVCREMKRGRNYSDVAIWLPLEDGRMMGEYPEELQVPGSQAAWELRYIYAPEETRGHHPLWVTYPFLKKATFENGRMTIGDAEFRALYVDVEFLSSDGLIEISRLAKEGLPVVLKRDPRQPGLSKSPEYLQLLDDLKRRRNVSSDFKEVVDWPKLVEARDGEKVPDFWARKDGSKTVIFFAHPLAQGLKLPLAYGQSYVRDPVERRLSIVIGRKKHDLDLRFEPYQSLLIEADEEHVEFKNSIYRPPVPRTVPFKPRSE